MPSRRARPEHQEAVSRRLALLSAELGHDLRPEPPPAVPAPGRHAAGRVTLGPAQLAVVAVLVAVGLAVTCWWVVRGDAEQIEAPALSEVDASPVAASPAAAAPVAASTAPAAAEVTVDVAGKVRRPGIVVLDGGARVVDAIEAAGGARPGVDLSSLNLARVLVDGEQVLVGVAVPAGVAAAALTGEPVGAPTGALVNLNTATQADLEALPEVGPVTAQAILSWRDEHGGFTAVDELLEVDGIGDATLAQVAPHVTV